MSYVYADECEVAGLNEKDVEKLAADLEKLGQKAKALGLTIFGGSGSGDLRFDDSTGRPLIVAVIGTNSFDGGDGGCDHDDSGMMRGE
jgi:hypothetical protein